MPRKGTVYVFLHGLTVLHETGGGIEMVLPDVEGHVYRAGNWLTETPFARKRGRFHLRGVRPGNKNLSDALFTIKLTGCSLTDRRRAATLFLPSPKEIIEMLIVGEPGTPVASTKSGQAIFPQLSMMVVLAYDYDDENEVRLDGHYWQGACTDNAMSLHIVSTSPEREGEDHERHTEAALNELIVVYPGLTFPKPSPPAPAWSDTANPDFDPSLAVGALQAGREYLMIGGEFAFAAAELEPFTARCVRLDRLGRLKQEGRPLEEVWYEPDELGASACNCGTIHVKS
jgi:hypothetical protein